MRFMILVKANTDTEAGVMPDQAMLTAMVDYHEDLAKAGVLVDANGLKPTSTGWRVDWRNGEKTIIDGPFAESKELIAGFTIIKVKSKQEAVDWVNRFPNPGLVEGHIEVRQMFELEDFEPGEAIDRFREMTGGTSG